MNRATLELKRVKEEAELVGLGINVKKTECMVFNIPDDQDKLMLESQEIIKVNDFKYLGSKVSSTESDFKNRKALAWLAY